MINASPIWLSEAEIVELMDLRQAIDALEAGLRRQAAGDAATMVKTHVTWAGGSTLHAIGAVFQADGLVGAKTWAHTEGGATPLLNLWDANTGRLLAIIEAFALGQMRTGGITGVATRWLARPDADDFAIFGTGKQALAQVAAIAAVRPLKSVRVWSPDIPQREGFADDVRALGGAFAVQVCSSADEAAEGAAIMTLVTRAREPFFTSAMVAPGAHVNAIGAITPERKEFEPDLLARARVVVADDPPAARKLSREFGEFYGEDDASWSRVLPLCRIVGGEGRPSGSDLTVFKAMGMGISDLSLGAEIYRRAVARGAGRRLPHPQRAEVRFGLSR